ncbi:hypothetical protein, partial [Klebsiella pneumoniae]
ENMFKEGTAYAKDISNFTSNMTQDGFTSSNGFQQAAQKMAQYAQSISNTETNAFSKTGGQASQLSMSSGLNIDGRVL